MIKVADFGLTEDMYNRNYFHRDQSEEGSEEKVPIKWMAPESIETGIYNEKTDVVSSYGCVNITTVWHNFSLAFELGPACS